jgi:DNA-binding MarR family transcriptional regulator
VSKANERSALIERIVDTNDQLMGALGRLHAADVLGIGATMAQVKVLYLLGSGDGLGMSHLASALGVTLPTVSGLVDRVVEAGYAGRHDDPADRRQVVVYRTPAGSAIVGRLHDLNRPLLDQLLESLSNEDLAIVARALAILTEAASRLAEASATSPALPSKPPATARAAAHHTPATAERSAL